MPKLKRNPALPALAGTLVALSLLTGCAELGSAAAQRVQNQLPAAPTLPPLATWRDDAVEAAREIRDRLPADLPSSLPSNLPTGIPTDLPRRAVDRLREQAETLDNIPTPEGITDLTLTQTAPPAGETAILGVEWTDRGEGGGQSLLVRPSEWARTAGFSGWEAVWQEIIAADPSADAPNMRDQLICHTIGAGDREVWHLEPWRPDVGLVSVITARCNPS